MLGSYSESYREIANRLIPTLPQNWSAACVLAEMRPDNGMVAGFARLAASLEPLWLDLPTSIYEAFRAMHTAARDSGDPAQLWTSATMRLDRDGKFDIRYGYDAVPIDDQFERVEHWTKSNL